MTARCFRFTTEAAADAAEALMSGRGRLLFAAAGYAVVDGDVIGKRNGVSAPDAQATERWAIPRQIEAGPFVGQWIVPHPDCLPAAGQKPPAAGGLTIGEYVVQDIDPSVPTSDYDPAWFPSRGYEP